MSSLHTVHTCLAWTCYVQYTNTYIQQAAVSMQTKKRIRAVYNYLDKHLLLKSSLKLTSFRILRTDM